MSNYPEFIQFSDGANNALPYLAMNNGFGGLGGLGSGFLGGIFGGLLSNAFGWGNGFGNNNGNAAAAALGAQAQNNNNTDLLMNAITSSGAQQSQAIQNLATMLGQDFNTVNTQISAVNGVLQQMAIQNATSPLQIINAINSGNAALAAQLSQCCCQAQLRVEQQTNTIVNAINQQTIAMNDKFCEQKERELQDKIDQKNETIAMLRDQAQTSSLQVTLAQMQAQIAALSAKLDATTTPASAG